MPELTPEERAKIYEEEKAKLEAAPAMPKAPAAKPMSSGTIGCLVIVAVFFIVIILGVINQQSRNTVGVGDVQSQQAAEKPIKINATALLSAYQANEIAADAKYKGRLVEVTGIVDSINKDFLDAPFLTLVGSEMFPWVQVSFTKGYEDWLMKLHKGQRVTTTGRCTGMLVGNVMVEVK